MQPLKNLTRTLKWATYKTFTWWDIPFQVWTKTYTQREIEISITCHMKIFMASKYFVNISEGLSCLSQCWHEVIQMYFYNNEYWQKLSTKQWTDSTNIFPNTSCVNHYPPVMYFFNNLPDQEENASTPTDTDD